MALKSSPTLRSLLLLSAAPLALGFAAAAQAQEPAVATETGKYFAKCKVKKPSREARDPAVAKRLWEMSEDLVRSV